MEKPWISQLNFITLKPVLYICNQNEEDVRENSAEQTIQNLCGERDEVISLSCSMESEISQLENPERKEFLADMGLEEPVLNRVIRKPISNWILLPFSRREKKKCGPGLCLPAHWLPRPVLLFIRILRGDLSVRRFIPAKIYLNIKQKKNWVLRVFCDLRERVIPYRTGM